MAKSEFLYLKGKVKWCRPSAVDQWGNWKTELYPDAASLEILKELQAPKGNIAGVKTVLKKDEDGYFCTIRRPREKQYGGKAVGFAPPEVLDGSQTLPDGSNPPLRDINIGNGSDATIKIVVYTHRVPGAGDAKGRAIRWEAIRIDNLVPFTGKKDFNENEEQATRGLSEQPKPRF